MVVCKYFQQGFCRFGQSCRFEHIYGSKYSYHANAQPQPSSGVTDEQLINQVQADIKSALHGGQWILSCYSPYKEKAIFPGIHDLSPEETRLFIYEARVNNNLDQAIAHINNLTKETRQKYEQLLQPNQEITKVLRSLYNGESATSPFSNLQSTGNTTPSSIFRSAVQGSVFNQNVSPSIFSQNVAQNSTPKDLFANAASQNIFNQNASFTPMESAPKSIFAQANQNVFAMNTQNNQQNVFSNANAANPSNLFANANQNLFQQQTQPSLPTNVFQKTETNATPNIFQQTNAQPSNIFGQAVQRSNEQGIYSKIEDLNEDDLKAFNSDSFELGFIPEVPPPQALC